MPPGPTAAPSDASPLVVLDTNVVLDWLLFEDRRCAALALAIVEARVRWIATAAMRGELAHVLARGLIRGRWPGNAESTLRGWDRWASVVEPTAAAALNAPRCSDRDDQMFIDLALGVRARFLVSRDRALLKLARRATPLGVTILTPERWTAPALDSPALKPQSASLPRRA
jgi:putative PIN family toxin of toxin-antitoxin system